MAAIGTVLLLELATLGSTNLAIREPSALALIYLVTFAPLVVGLVLSLAADRGADRAALAPFDRGQPA